MNNQNNENEQWKLLVLLLKEIADQKGIRQEEIANKSGLLQSNVSRFFSLKYKPTLDNLLDYQTRMELTFMKLTLFYIKALKDL